MSTVGDAYDPEQVAAFARTIEHAVSLHEKAEKLRAQCQESLVVASGFVDRHQVPHDVLCHAARLLRDLEVPGRGPFTTAANTITARPGQRFVRPRGDVHRWPRSPAWVYLLKQGTTVIYVGATEHLSNRLIGHRDKPWDQIEIIACATRADALALEGDLIFQHRPPLNKADLNRRRYVR